MGHGTRNRHGLTDMPLFLLPSSLLLPSLLVAPPFPPRCSSLPSSLLLPSLLVALPFPPRCSSLPSSLLLPSFLVTPPFPPRCSSLPLLVTPPFPSSLLLPSPPRYSSLPLLVAPPFPSSLLLPSPPRCSSFPSSLLLPSLLVTGLSKAGENGQNSGDGAARSSSAWLRGRYRLGYRPVVEGRRFSVQSGLRKDSGRKSLRKGPSSHP